MHLFSRHFEPERRTIIHTSSGSGGSPGSDSGSVGGSKIGTWITTSTHEPQSEVVSTPNLPKGKVAVTFSSGGGKASKVSGGKFKGRVLGGGSRQDIFGASVYGSGYPGWSARSIGVAGQPFPYFFYPIVWTTSTSAALPPYLDATAEYGLPTDTSRPGGALVQATLHSNTTGDVFHFIADNSTAQAVLPILRANCGVDANASSSSPFAYTGANAADPSPVDAIQYFRASSAVLILEGYNNTATLLNTPDVAAFPSIPTDTDAALLSCLNTTIGASMPLVDAPLKFHWGSLGIFLLILAGCAGLALVVTVACCFCCSAYRRRLRRQDAAEGKIEGGNVSAGISGNERGYGMYRLVERPA
ncbi:unnamed protein product [Peniophora sp. CBMAI 1063]|nr:unnamed protein product [Peniophora sp. CBMAI 1063]